MTNMTPIDYVRIRSFRSFADIEIDGLSRVAVLIGANGFGKSDFICFFEAMEAGRDGGGGGSG